MSGLVIGGRRCRRRSPRPVLDGLAPPWRASLANGGVRSSGKSRRVPVPSGGHRQGEDRTGESREPPLMSRYGEPRRWVAVAGCRAGRWEAAGAGRGVRPAGKSTAVPGVQEAPTPVVSRACGTWKPRRGPALVVAGKPTVRKAQLPGGNRMTEKRMPVAERQQETGARWPAPPPVVSDNWPDTGGCPDPKGC